MNFLHVIVGLLAEWLKGELWRWWFWFPDAVVALVHRAEQEVAVRARIELTTIVTDVAVLDAAGTVEVVPFLTYVAHFISPNLLDDLDWKSESSPNAINPAKRSAIGFIFSMKPSPALSRSSCKFLCASVLSLIPK